MLALILPLFIALFIAFHFTPMYHEAQESKREAMVSYLIMNYNNLPAADRQKLMIDYGITDNEINPQLILDNVWQKPQNPNLSGLKDK